MRTIREKKTGGGGEFKRRNKKILGAIELVLIVAFFLCIFFMNSSYAMIAPENALGSGVKNIYLTYFTNDKRVDKEQLKELIVYKDQNGNYTTDTYMDTFVFLPRGDVSYNPYKVSEYTNNLWNNYLADEMKDMRLLDEAVGELNQQNGTNIKVKVMMTAFYHSNNSMASTTNASIDKMIDSQIDEFVGNVFSNLELLGFYWYNEGVQAPYENTIKHFNQYAHGGNKYGIEYKTLWVPYIDHFDQTQADGQWAEGNRKYREGYRTYGFDLVSLQSSHYFHGIESESTNAGKNYIDFWKTNNHLTVAAQESSAYQTAVAVEEDERVYDSSFYYNNYISFLKAGLQNGWNQSVNVFYATDLHYGANAKDQQSRNIYEFTYRYAKKTLSNTDLNVTFEEVTYPNNFTNLALGKSYTYSTPYTVGATGCPSADNYRCVDGKEFTDGSFGVSGLGSSWVVFRTLNQSDDYFVTIDLGKQYSNISYVDLELQQRLGDGVIYPSSIDVYYSTDGSSWNHMGSCSWGDYEQRFKRLAYLNANNSVSARYMKVVLHKTAEKNMIALSEIRVGQRESQTASVSFVSKRGRTSVSTGSLRAQFTTENVGTLSVSSSNNEVATAKLFGDYVEITPVSFGTAVITLKESKYGQKDTYTVTVEDDTIAQIRVSKVPTKKTYYMGTPSLDLSGGEIEVIYRDNTSRIFSMVSSGVSTTGFHSNQLGTNIITVRYQGYTATFDILIIEDSITGISVNSLPSKTKYYPGNDILDLTGGTILVTYASGVKKTINMSESLMEVSGFDNTKVGTNTITLQYEGYTTSFDIEFVEAGVKEIQVLNLPNKTNYIQGQEDLNLAGGKLKVIYEDGMSDIIYMNDPLVTVEGFSNVELGTNTITVHCLNHTTTFDITIIAPESEIIPIESIAFETHDLELSVGERKELIALVLPENATDKTILFESSNDNVARVDENGRVKAIGVGEATIIVKNLDGSIQDRMTVTISSGITVKPVDPVDPPVNDPDMEEEIISTPNTASYKNTLLIILGCAIFGLGFVYYKKFVALEFHKK